MIQPEPDVVVEEPGHEVEGGVEAVCLHADVVQQRGALAGARALRHLVRGGRRYPELGQAHVGGGVGVVGAHHTADQGHELQGVRHLH